MHRSYQSIRRVLNSEELDSCWTDVDRYLDQMSFLLATEESHMGSSSQWRETQLK